VCRICHTLVIVRLISVPFSDDDIKVWLEIERRSARKPQSSKPYEAVNNS